MTIAFISAVWRRVSLTAVWWQQMDRFRAVFQQHGFETFTAVSGSEPEHAALCRAHGGLWVEHENRPLGAKWNAVAHAALARGADYLFILGSDDFFSTSLLLQYADALKDRVPYVGLDGLYIYSLPLDQLLSFHPRIEGRHLVIQPTPDHPKLMIAYPKNNPTLLGSGRCIQRSLFMNRETYWDADRDHGLDASLARNLVLPLPKLLVRDSDSFAVDVKSGGANIWSFDHLRDTCAPAPPELIHSLPEWEALQCLR